MKHCILQFKPLTFEDAGTIKPFLAGSGSRSCDYSLGGLLMWIGCFGYEYCIHEDTLFIKGRMGGDSPREAFSLPIGRLSLPEAVSLLRSYCRCAGRLLDFSAIPCERIDEFRGLNPMAIGLMRHYSDYLYDIREMATYAGKRMAKKRNHQNRFMRDNPDWRVEEIGAENIALVKECFRRICEMEPADSAMQAYEREQVTHVLERPELYGFESLCLFAGGEVVAFTFGEVVGDTLHDHIEKMRRDVAGSGETVFSRFSAAMLEKYPHLNYVNREDDAGDIGLQRSKLSYNPVMMIDKYNVLFE